jgi:hypothetical protein
LIELGLVGGLLALLVGGAAAVTYLPWDILFGGGVVMGMVGVMVGVPAGAGYHVILYRVLRRSGPVPRVFWLHPTDFHKSVPDNEMRRVRRWFFVGGAGFALALLGAALIAIGAWRSGPA